jgi:hypothetical protein
MDVDVEESREREGWRDLARRRGLQALQAIREAVAEGPDADDDYDELPWFFAKRAAHYARRVLGRLGEPCECLTDDPRVCWAIRFPDEYLTLDRNPDCSCACHEHLA